MAWSLLKKKIQKKAVWVKYFEIATKNSLEKSEFTEYCQFGNWPEVCYVKQLFFIFSKTNNEYVSNYAMLFFFTLAAYLNDILFYF